MNNSNFWKLIFFLSIMTQIESQKKNWLVSNSKETQPGSDGQNASGWYWRLRGLTLPSLVMNSDQPSQQSFDVWHFLDKIASDCSYE